MSSFAIDSCIAHGFPDEMQVSDGAQTSLSGDELIGTIPNGPNHDWLQQAICGDAGSELLQFLLIELPPLTILADLD